MTESVTWQSFTGVTLLNNNLTAKINTREYSTVATVGKDRGKWYWEIIIDTSNKYVSVGVTSKIDGKRIFDSTLTRAYGLNNGRIGDVISFLLDMDNGILSFWKNGSPTGNTYTDLKELETVYAMATSSSSISTNAPTITANFGDSPFVYEMPIGYKPYGFSLLSKMFIQFNNEYKTFNGDDWETIAPSELNSEIFLTKGMNKITGEIQRDFESKYGKQYRILCWTNEFMIPKFIQIAYPQSQLVYPNDDILINGVESIDKLNLIAEGNAKIVISFDSGLTWNSYDNEWIQVNDASKGMDVNTFNSLTSEQLNLLRNGSNTVRFSYFLGDKNSKIDYLNMNVTMQGYDIPVSASDYTLEYDEINKKIIYNILKDGTYTINYISPIEPCESSIELVESEF